MFLQITVSPGHKKNEGIDGLRILSVLISENNVYAGTEANSVFRRNICDLIPTECHSISGTITFKNNNQPVSQGTVKALYYDNINDEIEVLDSTVIQSNGTYTLPHCPTDSIFIMVYQNDDLLQFVPTYFPSTIDWQQATRIYPIQNLSNIDVQVYRINNSNNPYSISGLTQSITGQGTNNLQDAIVYAKIGNDFKNYGISISNGSYVADKLPPGTYNLTAYRMGYNCVSQNVTITNNNLTSINFNFGNPIGIQKENSSTPDGYSLSQNYPNPFNPVTIINYQLPFDSYIKLSIYDILGREVAILVNEKQNSGTYKVEWNASQYSSGVYFYQIQADKFVESKKMLLLK